MGAFLFGMTGLGYVWGNLWDSPVCILVRHRRIGHVLVLFPSAKLVLILVGFPLSRKKGFEGTGTDGQGQIPEARIEIGPKWLMGRIGYICYANETYLLNAAMLGMAAKQWHYVNPEVTG